MSEADDVQFGRLDRPFPRPGQRYEDRSGVACGCVGIRSGNQLPIYVDLDAWREMEQHASEDPNVELGGVLLGEPFQDPTGQPFVVIQRVLRAKHYRSTQGSFTFTHDTWAQITQDKDQLARSSRIVGWYHTHPGWGVFLSSADLFICQHYFNNPLDVAVVIDPRRRQYGVFCWHGHQMIQVSGFYLTATTSRLAELEEAVRRASNMTTSSTAMCKEPVPGEIQAAAFAPQGDRSDAWGRLARWLAVAVLLCLALQIACTAGSLLLAWKVTLAVATLAQQHQALLDRLDQAIPARLPDDVRLQGEQGKAPSAADPAAEQTTILPRPARDRAATDAPPPTFSLPPLAVIRDWLGGLATWPAAVAVGILGTLLSACLAWQIIRVATTRRRQKRVHEDEEPVQPV